MKAILFAGQGSQRKGMGGDLFRAYPDIAAEADGILGYSLEELCLRDPEGRLQRTEFTQPAVFSVGCMYYRRYLEEGRPAPDFLAGHSLGEYNALLAAGAFDFATGLRLVRERARLMAGAGEGGMAAVMGLAESEVAAITLEMCPDLDVANYNSPDQVVLSGPKPAILAARAVFERLPGVRYQPLKVSGAFHSRRMRDAAAAFSIRLEEAALHPLGMPVLSNFTGLPHGTDPRGALAKQIDHSVRWTDGVRYLLGAGVDGFVEMGPARILTPMVEAVRTAQARKNGTGTIAAPSSPRMESAGPSGFRRDFTARFPVYFGASGYGFENPGQVAALRAGGCPAVFGTWSSPSEIRRLRGPEASREKSIPPMGLSIRPGHPPSGSERAAADLILALDAPLVEAQGYVRITPELVLCRAKGMAMGPDGPVPARKLAARIPFPSLAGDFLRPPAGALLKALVAEGRLTPAEAEAAGAMPLADVLIVEGDSRDPSRAAGPFESLTSVLDLRGSLAAAGARTAGVHIGISGGIATPELAAAAFFLGASFICLSGLLPLDSESGLSAPARAMLAGAGAGDADWCPDPDFPAYGSERRVLRKGVLFCQRAAALKRLDRERIAPSSLKGKAREALEGILGMDIPSALAKARTWEPLAPGADPASPDSFGFLLRWYLRAGLDHARRGTPGAELDYHIPCGSDIGLFNSWRLRNRAGVSGDISIAGILPEFFAQVSSLAARPMPAFNTSLLEFAR